MATENVVIEFSSDTSQLQPAVDKLTAMGAIDEQSAVIFKATNDQIKQRNLLLADSLKSTQGLSVSVDQQQAIYNKLVASVKNLSGASKDSVQQLLKLSAGDIAKGFQQVGISVDQYVKAMEGAGTFTTAVAENTQTLRSELRDLQNQMGALTLANQTGTEEFANLAARAGEVKNAMKDTQQVVVGLGEDVPILKTFGAAAQGITSGFSAASGAVALFGDDSEDMQKVLVRVNALMAVQQGVSSLVALANDKATISTAKLAVAQLTNNAQTAISVGLESESVIVRGAATVAQYALNLAMSLNPIGIVVIALASFITGIIAYTSAAKLAAEATGDLNAALDASGEILEAGIAGQKRSLDKQLAELDAHNAKESEKMVAQQHTLVQIQQSRADAIQEIDSKLQQYQNSTDKDVIAKAQELSKQRLKLEEDYSNGVAELAEKRVAYDNQLSVEQLEASKANADARVSLAIKNSNDQFAAQRVAANAQAALDIKAAGDSEEKINAIRAALHRQLLDINYAQDQANQVRTAAGLEDALTKSQIESQRINDRISDEEIERQKAIIQEKADFDVKAEGLTATEKANIQDKARLQKEQLDRAQTQREIQYALEDEKSRDAIILSQVQISDKEKLNAQIDSIFAEAAIEISLNKGKSDKIKEIEAKRDQDVAAAHKSFNEKLAQEDLARLQVTNSNANAELQRQLDAQDQIRNSSNPKRTAAQLEVPILNLDQQFAAIDKLTEKQKEATAIDFRLNEQNLADKAISQKEYNDKYAELVAKNVKIDNDGEQHKREAAKATADFKKEQTKVIIADSIQGISDGLSLLSTLYQQNDQADQQRLDAKKQRIQDELDAGEITQKEADSRNKQLDAQQKKMQHDQAVRNKQLAIFQAIISTAQAVVQALDAPPPVSFISAGIAAALGAAQIAIIASQPIPQFARGKKDGYQGLGEVGEAGTELIEKDGKMFVVDKPSIVWLAGSDKVYNPAETRMMMNTNIPAAENNRPVTFKIDYEKLGEAVGRNIPGFGLNIDQDGFSTYIKEKQLFTKRLNDRRSWKR